MEWILLVCASRRSYICEILLPILSALSHFWIPCDRWTRPLGRIMLTSANKAGTWKYVTIRFERSASGDIFCFAKRFHLLNFAPLLEVVSERHVIKGPPVKTKFSSDEEFFLCALRVCRGHCWLQESAYRVRCALGYLPPRVSVNNSRRRALVDQDKIPSTNRLSSKVFCYTCITARRPLHTWFGERVLQFSFTETNPTRNAGEK